jgi:hypothetical protein
MYVRKNPVDDLADQNNESNPDNNGRVSHWMLENTFGYIKMVVWFRARGNKPQWTQRSQNWN